MKSISREHSSNNLRYKISYKNLNPPEQNVFNTRPSIATIGTIINVKQKMAEFRKSYKKVIPAVKYEPTFIMEPNRDEKISSVIVSNIIERSIRFFTESIHVYSETYLR